MLASADVHTLRRALAWILAISLGGVAFSGSLTYRELIGTTALSCPAPGAPGTIFGYPACVYGLAMYALLAGISGWALFRTRTSSVGNRGAHQPAEQSPR